MDATLGRTFGPYLGLLAKPVLGSLIWAKKGLTQGYLPALHLPRLRGRPGGGSHGSGSVARGDTRTPTLPRKREREHTASTAPNPARISPVCGRYRGISAAAACERRRRPGRASRQKPWRW